MPRLYKYLFYRLYYWNLNGFFGWKDPDLASLQALAGLASVMLVNVWVLLDLADLIIGPYSPLSLQNFLVQIRSNTLSRIVFLAMGIAFLILISNRKSYWRRIINEFDELKETKLQKLVGALGLWLYCLISGCIWYAFLIN